MAKFLPLKKSEFREFYAISTQFGRGNNREIQNDNGRPVLMGYRGEPKIPGTVKPTSDKPGYSLSSPTLQQLRSDNYNVQIVQFVGRFGQALSPD